MGARADVVEQEQTQRSGLAAVGARLAQAREQQQRTVESVASELHLRPEVVQAIEAGDEAQLPAATFLREYIKAYARLLELDDAGLVAQLPIAAGHSPEPLKRVGMRRRRSGVSL
ncbi:MAG: helix-turn-helix domain-containing protein, partial [Thiogranum sp.]